MTTVGLMLAGIQPLDISAMALLPFTEIRWAFLGTRRKRCHLPNLGLINLG